MDSLENDNSLIPVPTLNLEQAKKEGWDDSSLMPTPTAKQEIVEADHKEEVKRSVDEIMLGIKPQKILPGIPTTDNTPTPGVETNNSGGFLDNLGKAIQSASESTIGAGNPVALLGSDQDPLAESIRSMPLYRTIMLTDEQKLADAQKIGSAVGINPMSLAVNQWMYDDAKYIYDQQKNMEMLQGRPFSASAIHELYPEVDLSDPVAAAMALKDTRSLLASRQTIQDIDNSWIMNGIKNNIAFIANSWNEGQRMDEVTEIQYAAMQGKITDEEAARKISVLIPDEEENVGTVGTVVKETLKQVSMQKNQILRAASDIVGVLGPRAPQLFRVMAITAPGAGLAAGAAAGVSGAGLAVGGAIAGIGLGTAAIFLGSYRAQAGANYWQYRQRRNANGTPLYTQEQAKDMAKRDAIVQAAIETSLLRYAYAPISKVFGKNAATAIIENTATRNKLLTAGVRAYKGIAAKQAARQAVRGTLSEVAEEGAQDLVSSIDERFMGNNQMTMSAMMNSAVDAMLDALPAAIGMTVPGAALRGVGSFHAMKRVDRAMLGDAKEEYRRENEKSMGQRLLEIGSSSKLKSTSPEAYAKTIQNQLQRQGMGTLYVDASQAVETEQGQAALNQLIEDKVVTAKEVSEAVENGTQLEISPGTYFQTATPEIAETISEYSTFDKAGRTLADIKAARRNLQKVVDTLNQTHEEREATAIQGILDKDFSDPKERAVMEEILPGNLEDIPKAIRAKTDEVKTQLADLTGAQSKINYIKNKRKTGKTSDVGVIDVVGESGQHESKRVSGDEGWYSAWYEDNKKAPSIRDAYDIAYKEAMAEIEYSDDPDAKAAGEEITALMEKLETLEDLAPKVKAMDTREIMARTMLSDEAFNAVYLPAAKELQKGNSAVREAGRDSALILAKTAEAFHESYGTPYEEFARITMDGKVSEGAYGMSASEQNRKISSLKEFPGVVNTKFKEAPEKAKFTSIETGIRYPGERIKHVENKHGITGEDLEDIDLHMNALYEPAITAHKDKSGDLFGGQYQGTHVLARVHGNKGDYRIVLTFMPNGTVVFESAYKGTKEGIKKDIATHNSGVLPRNGVALPSGSSVAMSIPMIKEQLGIVNQSKYKKTEDDYNGARGTRRSSPDQNLLQTSPVFDTSTIAGKGRVYKSGKPYNQMATQTGVYFQRAWHGSPYTFESFDLGKIGSGEGNQVHGWGLYFAKDKKVAESYKDVFGGTKGDEHQASIYEVEVPEDTVLLDEEKDFNEQPQKVKSAIQKLIKNLTDEELENAGEDVSWEGRPTAIKNVMEMLKDFDGKGIYNTLYDIFGGDKEASLKLNKYGVKGIAYGGREDGRCFVVFDDKAIQIIQRYNQTVTMGDIAKQKLAADQKDFAGYVDQFMKNEFNASMIPVMNTPLVMQLVGAENLPIEIAATDLAKILKKKHAGEIDPAILKQLPKVLSDPLMIFNNRYSGKTGGDRKIIMVDLKDKNGATIVVPFELSVDNKQGKYQINQMLSTFGKSDKKTGVPRFNWFAEQLEAGRLVYVNKNKTAEWISSEKPEWPMPEEIINGFIFNSNVPNETDLVNLWNSHPAMYQGDEHIGAYDRDTNLIALFNGANQSTVIHETAHAWLTMLTRVAQNGNEKAGKDLETIRSWASFSEENIKEYAGTSLEKEFFGYAAKLRENPNDLATQDRYMQERFARGFERYLMTGSAPSKELRGVFRRFKKWLIGIYQDIKNLGKADPPEDIRRIFDSVVATQKEVDAWAAQRRLDATKLPIDYTKTEKENIDTWIENIKETVQERCLKNFMDQTKDEAMKSFDATIEEAKDQWRQELLQQHPVYQFEMTRQLHPTRKDWRNYLAENGMDEESYQKALQAAGGPLEEVIAEMAKDQRDQYIENVLTPDMIRETAEAMMQTPEGQSKKASMEAAMIKQRINKYIRTATLSLMELNRAEDPKTIALTIKERNGLLTDEDKHQLEKGRLEGRITASEAQVQNLRSQLTELVDGLKTAREGLDYPIGKMRQQAETTLADEKISKATNWKWWDNKARSASRRGAEALRKKDWAAVAMEKQNELHYATMARVAKEYEDNIKKELRGNPKAQTSALDKDGLEKYGILGIVNQIGRTDKPVRMSNQSRYFVQHMAFQLGLTNKDGVQPIDANGAPVEFSWSAMAMELNPTQAMSAQEDGNAYLGDDVIAPWLKSIFDGNNQTAYENLTYNQFHDIVTAMKAVYKMGRREYEGNTLRLHGEPTSFDQAAFALVRSPWTHKREDPFYAKNRKKALQRLASKLHHAVDTLTLPEILFERLGPDWYELFYQTIDRAAATKRQMTDEANQTLNTVLNMYNREEWRQMRSEKIYQMGHDEYGQPFMVTKEALLSAALNWGNRTNRDRLMETYRMREGEIEDVLFANLTEKDWDFVEAVWKHIGSYWDGRNLVQNNTLGIPLGKVHGLTFTLPDGRKIEGAYYPIKYDPDTSVRAQERDANEIVKSQMQGVSTFALGMGSTKSRAMTSGDQRLRTDLEVYIEHVTESVQHISMREATVDVYKLITRKDVMDELVARVGMDQYNILKRWAADQWHSPMDKMGDMERFLNRMRGKMTFATMAYRVSTAVLNATNIFPMMDRMGAGNAIYAIGDMYGGNYMEKRNFILSKSSFMRERATNLDRDLMRERKLPVGQNTWKGISITQDLAERSGKLGYTMITETDFMLSLPQWLATYKGAVHELTTKNENAKVKKTTEEIEAAAVLRADKAVRETFGSGEMKDQANLLKGKYIQQFLPFYSYTGLVLNQFIRAGYMIYDGKGAGQLMRSMLFWWILPVTLEAGLRYGMSAAAGDDKEDFWQRLGISLASGGPIGGIPFARDGIPYLAAKIMGAYGGDGKTDFYAATVFGDAIKIVEDLLSDKKDIIDVGRDVSRVSNRFLRVSDTLTDGFWTMLRCLYSDTDKSITEIIASILLDKQVKEKKGDKK